MKNYLVTGGAGFIGSYVVRELLKQDDAFIYNLDKMGVGSDVKNLVKNDRVKNIYHDICDLSFKYNLKDIDYIIHLAAESHVDRSINDPQGFVNSNVLGTQNILTVCREHNARMVHVSTDEVYGHLLDGEPPFTEEHPLKPRSPYSATKAGSDLLVQSFVTTYEVDVSITRCCNNYGERQHDEKLIPTIIRSIMSDVPVPVYGDGKNMREWIHAQDHARAILEVLYSGERGQVYNIPGSKLISNIELINMIIDYINEKYPQYDPAIEFVSDRLGHDFKYELTTKHHLAAVKDQREFDIKRVVDYYINKKYTA